MIEQIKHLFSKERVSDLLSKKLFNKEKGKIRYTERALRAQQRYAIAESLNKERVSQNRTEKRSVYGIRLREFRKIMNLYTNISKKYLKSKIKLFHNTPTKIEENFFSSLESRLDVILWRASFFDSISSARQAIRSGEVLVNRIAVITPAAILKAGDLVSLLEEQAPYSCNRNNVNKEMLSQKRSTGAREGLYTSGVEWCVEFKKIETLLQRDRLSAAQSALQRTQKQERKRNLSSSLQTLIDFIVFSTRKRVAFRKTNLSNNNTSSNNGVYYANSVPLREKTNRSNRNRASRKDILNGNFLRNNSVEQRNWDSPIIKKPLLSFNESYKKEDYFIVLNYYLYLKDQLKKNPTIQRGYSFKGTNQFKKGKPAHLEISYTSLSIIFLFPPQFIKFSDFINYSEIFK